MANLQVQKSVDGEDLLNLTAEIEHTKRRLRDLEEQQERLKQLRAAQFGILPSLRRVPVEIISEIFQLAVPETVDEEGRENLVQILCVCRDWLNVALSTSCLWASLDVVIGPRFSHHLLLPRMSAWFSRAGPLPLTLSLVDFNADTSDVSAFSTWISTKCWKNLKIKLPGSHLFKPIFHNLKEADGHCWGRLKSLSLRSWGQGDDMTFSNTETPFTWGDLPCLRDLSLSLGVNLSLTEFQAPWAQLTTLNLAALLTLAEYLDILKQCIRLEVCKINRIFKSRMDEMIFPSEPIILPNLYILRISKADNVTPLLSCLRLPAVTDLSIDQVYSEDEDEGMAIAEFITRSQCSIRRLTLKNIWAEDESIVEILKATPALVEFTFRSYTSDGSFLTHIRGAHIIPKLEKIEFEGSPLNVIPPNFFNFVMSRSTPTCKLAHALFKYNPPLGEQRIREGGVELVTEY